MVTAVILMTGSVLVILENITKIFHPQPVNDEGILWLGIIAVSINVLASLVIRKGQTKNESILSLHFLEDTLGWVAVILMAIVLRFTDWYILDPVSYTHLDVYKRQVSGRINSCRNTAIVIFQIEFYHL